MSVSRANALAWWGAVLLAVSVAAYSHESGADDAVDKVPVSEPVNLQVLSKDLSGQSVRRLMKQYSRELGVSCSHCHVEDPESQTVDYVSDDKATKQTARAMIAMLNDINDRYLAQLERDPRYSLPVTCGSCHQGQSTPLAFEAGEL
jgi:hypothetical protein